MNTVKKVLIIIIVLLIVIIVAGLYILFFNNKTIEDDSTQDINIPLKVTKTINENTKDSCIETNIVNFKRGFATTIETTYTFNNEESAEMMYAWQKNNQKLDYNTEMKVEKDGLTIKINNTMKAYSSYYLNFTGAVTRKEIKQEFENNGYIEDI